jgi:cell division septum initiation protein DivIVA
LPLADLVQQLSQKQSEVEALRRAYEQRLQGLQRRKEELETELRQLDTEIQAATKQHTFTAPVPVPQRQPSATISSAESAAKQTLPQVLVAIVREKGRPVKVAELSDELVRRKYPTTSTNLPKMVGIKVADLINKGVLKRSEGQEGVTLAQAKKASTTPAKTAATKTPASNGQASRDGSTGKQPRTTETPPLRDVLTELLRASKKPLKAKELASQALARGYKTKSKTFVDSVWTALGQMKNVENVRGEGYRLKRSAFKVK